LPSFPRAGSNTSGVFPRVVNAAAGMHHSMSGIWHVDPAAGVTL
jgi:hypothetical protein